MMTKYRKNDLEEKISKGITSKNYNSKVEISKEHYYESKILEKVEYGKKSVSREKNFGKSKI